jgi:hypothetical protein
VVTNLPQRLTPQQEWAAVRRARQQVAVEEEAPRLPVVAHWHRRYRPKAERLARRRPALVSEVEVGAAMQG